MGREKVKAVILCCHLFSLCEAVFFHPNHGGRYVPDYMLERSEHMTGPAWGFINVLNGAVMCVWSDKYTLERPTYSMLTA